jgi:hypothetical protein
MAPAHNHMTCAGVRLRPRAVLRPHPLPASSRQHGFREAARPSRRCRRPKRPRLAAALGRKPGHGVAVEADGAAGVVVAGNREGDAIGSTFESRIATTGMPSTLASLIASSSLLASITNITSGMPPMSRMPPAKAQACRARGSAEDFLLGEAAVSPESCSSSVFRRLIDWRWSSSW